MHITWHGHSCFKIIGKADGNEVTLIIDPYNQLTGWRQIRGQADIVTLNNTQSAELDPGGIASGYFLIDKPGEYEVKKIYIEGIQGHQDAEGGKERGLTTLYQIALEGIVVVHLGYLSSILSDQQVSQIETCDILCVPVGGHGVLDVKGALSVIGQLEPMVILPMLYHGEGGKFEYDPIDAFAREMGISTSEILPKLKVTKKDIVSGETRTILLEKV